MKRRCYKVNRRQYKNYGARGIAVCDEWRDSFEVFREWAIEHGYKVGMTIERKNNDGNYEPCNCQWIPISEQAANTRQNVWIEAFGERKLLVRWAEDPRCSVCTDTIQLRLRLGWTAEAAISTPPANTNNRKKSPGQVISPSNQ